MADPTGAGFLGLGKAFDIALGLIGGLAMSIWGWVTHRFEKVEAIAEAALPRAEFEKAHHESREDRQNLRIDIKELFGKSEALREQVNVKVEAATQRMEDKIDRLRADMNGGLNGIRDEIRGLRS